MAKENRTTEVQSVVAASEAGDKQEGEEEEEDGFDELLSIVGFGRWQVRPTGTHPSRPPGWHVLNQRSYGLRLLPLPDQTFPLAATTTNLTWAAASLDINETIHDLEHNRDLDYNRVRQVVFAIYKVTNNTYYTQTCQNASALQQGPAARVVMAVYDTSVFTSTIFSEFHLLCEQAHHLPLYQMVYNFGGMFGSILGGQIGDRYGRLTVLRIAAWITCFSAWPCYSPQATISSC
ncbi:hypothetical protein Pcinc_019431 [Petrolisthes cinctipes]|uniref:Major facilitator superfamily (MFS) profile domain-containing protein n=1 Tax=Petrolisthes cinctipes TaxID=88211 RepID=A0AAE1FL76_PETCI|nr:hypothetical protein Pcinc_019431 [Petrolisthes cinctipes]